MNLVCVICCLPWILHAQLRIVEFLTKIEITEERSGMPYVDCIYVINLDKRPDRWTYMQSQMQLQGLNANRVSAFDGWKMSQYQRQCVLNFMNLDTIAPGHLGCFLSHISVWKDAFNRNFEVIWVLEDDAVFRKPVSDLVPMIELLDNIDPDWDIFYTDYREMPQFRDWVILLELQKIFFSDLELSAFRSFSKGIQLTENLVRTFGRTTTHSMLISKRGIKKLLQHSLKRGVVMAVDKQIHYIDTIRQYMTTDMIVTTDCHLGSDTGSNKNYDMP